MSEEGDLESVPECWNKGLLWREKAAAGDPIPPPRLRGAMLYLRNNEGVILSRKSTIAYALFTACHLGPL